MNTLRRYYLDKAFSSKIFYGKVLDIGGKKIEKRGNFIPPEKDIESWRYLNIDKDTEPDYLCNADEIPVEDNTFDFVILSEVLEHLENPIKVLRECYRVLKKDGQLIASMPLLFPIHADPYDYQRWTNVKIQNELLKINFINTKINPMGGYFAVTFDLLYISLTMASKNRRSLVNRVLLRLLSLLRPFSIYIDKKFIYKSKVITTGYYIEAEK